MSNAESKLNLFVSLQEIKKKTLQGTFEQVSINTININADIEHESYNLNAMLILFHMHLHEYFTWFWLLFKSKSLKELSI